MKLWESLEANLSKRIGSETFSGKKNAARLNSVFLVHVAMKLNSALYGKCLTHGEPCIISDMEEHKIC